MSNINSSSLAGAQCPAPLRRGHAVRGLSDPRTLQLEKLFRDRGALPPEPLWLPRLWGPKAPCHSVALLARRAARVVNSSSISSSSRASFDSARDAPSLPRGGAQCPAPLRRPSTLLRTSRALPRDGATPCVAFPTRFSACLAVAHGASQAKAGGEYRARTGDLLVANQALSQLS